MSPARSTVLRDVLVTSCTGIVNAIYIPPVPGLWQLSEVQEFKRKSCSSGRESSSVPFYKYRELKAAGSPQHASKDILNPSGRKDKDKSQVECSDVMKFHHRSVKNQKNLKYCMSVY